MNVNATKAIPPEQLGKAISETLLEWADNEEKKFEKAIDEAADACNETAKQYLSKGHGLRTGDYKENFSIDEERPAKHHYRKTWFVDGGRHRLTHLLENGHLTRNGTKRTKAVKHIKYGRQIAERVLDEKLAGLWGG